MPEQPAMATAVVESREEHLWEPARRGPACGLELCPWRAPRAFDLRLDPSEHPQPFASAFLDHRPLARSGGVARPASPVFAKAPAALTWSVVVAVAAHDRPRPRAANRMRRLEIHSAVVLAGHRRVVDRQGAARPARAAQLRRRRPSTKVRAAPRRARVVGRIGGFLSTLATAACHRPRGAPPAGKALEAHVTVVGISPDEFLLAFGRQPVLLLHAHRLVTGDVASVDVDAIPRLKGAALSVAGPRRARGRHASGRRERQRTHEARESHAECAAASALPSRGQASPMPP